MIFLGCNFFNRILPFNKLLGPIHRFNQGIECQVGIVDLDNGFSKGLGLNNCGKLCRALKNILTSLIYSFLDITAPCTQLCLFNNKVVLHLLELSNFLSNLTLQLSLHHL